MKRELPWWIPLALAFLLVAFLLGRWSAQSEPAQRRDRVDVYISPFDMQVYNETNGRLEILISEPGGEFLPLLIVAPRTSISQPFNQILIPVKETK